MTWCEYKLGEVTENFDSMRKPVKGTDRKAGSFPYYGASGIVDFVDDFIFDGEYLLIAEDGENLRTRKTPIAFIATGKYWVNNHAHIVRGNHRANTKYLSYALKVTDVSGYLTGSTMPKLTQGNMNQIRLELPEILEQERIVNVLGALDDKIENNRLMNETLEEMARAIFKSWFVDFDPVHAKAAGNAPANMDAETAALFPSLFGDDGLPVGWTLSAIEEHGDVITGKTPSTKRGEYFGDSYPFIKIPNMHSVWVTETEISLSEAGHQAQSKKLLPVGSVVVSCIASPGAVAIVSTPSHTNQQINAVVPNEECTTGWLYCALVNLRTEIIGMASGGSVTPNLNKGDFSRIKMVDPSKPIVDAFDRVTAHLFDKILSNYKENKTLAELRDALLPKLMSGAIRVADAEREVEAAV